MNGASKPNRTTQPSKNSLVRPLSGGIKNTPYVPATDKGSAPRGGKTAGTSRGTEGNRRSR